MTECKSVKTPLERELDLSEKGEEIDVSYQQLISSLMYLAENDTYHKRSKHIDIRHHFVCDAISSNLIKVGHLRTDEMPAVILTKKIRPV